MKTRSTLAFRVFLMILITGVFPILVITLVSEIIMDPLFTDLDEQTAISEMDQLLDIIEGALNNDKITVGSIAAYLVPVASGLQKADFPVIIDVYSIDFLSISAGGSFEGRPCWLRTETGIGEITDTKRFLNSVMEGPYAPGLLSPWGFISVGDNSDLYMLTASSGDSDSDTVIIGHKISSVLSDYLIQYPEIQIKTISAPADHGQKTVSSFYLGDSVFFDPITPASSSISNTESGMRTSVIVSAPYLNNGLLIELEQPSVIREAGTVRQNRTLAVVAALLIAQIVLITLWVRFQISRPLGILIDGIDLWDGLRFPDFGDLKSRSDEIGKLAVTFIRMSGEIRSKTRSLEEQAVRDGLTGLFNRRRFDETLQNEWERHRRDGNSLSLIMADVDFFKLYNDSYGHQEGDDCLRLVAQACGKNVHRPGDLPFRYGGEEFALILADTDLNGAIGVAESIRKGVEELNLINEDSPIGGLVTMSFGVAVSGPDGEISRDYLIRLADQALYRAKKAGRNRVIS